MQISALNRFFSEYRNIAAKIDLDEEETINHYVAFFAELSIQLLEIQNFEIDNASHFNIFNIIRMESYEALTHTPLLANLLDPRGSHAQGLLFYNAFIDRLPTTRKDQFRASRLYVTPEHWTSDGFIDIFIRSQDPTNPFCIVLENKINAGDQPDQLSRYYKYALNELGYSQDRILLLYLTKSGASPSIHSMKENDQQELIMNDSLHSISYKVFMLELLNDIIPKVRALSVRHTIAQYVKLISTF